MLAEMKPHHLGEWLALYRIDPWGEWRADLRMGIHASVLANVNRDPKRKPQPYTADDFMPKFTTPAEPEAAPDLADKIKAIFSRFRK